MKRKPQNARCDDADWDHGWCLNYYCRGCGSKVNGHRSERHRENCAEVERWKHLPSGTLQPMTPPLASSAAWSQWMDRLRDDGVRHGGALAHALASPADADLLLSWALEQGLIQRQEFAPTPEQKFLGIGGTWKHLDAYPCAYHYAITSQVKR